MLLESLIQINILPALPKIAPLIISGMEKHFNGYVPDKEPKEIISVPGQLQTHNENTCKSRFVWLPIEWDGDKPIIRWQKEWRI